MNKLVREMRLHCRAVLDYLGTTRGIGIGLVDPVFSIVECNDSCNAFSKQ